MIFLKQTNLLYTTKFDSITEATTICCAVLLCRFGANVDFARKVLNQEITL
jgi:hypothetical protein